MALSLPPLYPILDSSFFPVGARERSAYLERIVAEFADAGVSWLQLRMKQDGREAVLRAAENVRAAAPAGMCLILNDYAELVRDAGFSGVHLGQDDASLTSARAMLGADAILGCSTHTREQAAAADATSADYVAIGPVFSTATKLDASPSIGLAGVRAARIETGKPLVAIGGIKPSQARSVWDAGANSVAVIGALFAAGNSPPAIARDFLRLFR